VKAGPPAVSQAGPVIVFPVPDLIAPLGEFEVRKIHWQSLPQNRFKNSIFETRILNCKKFSKIINYEIIRKHFVKEKRIGGDLGGEDFTPKSRIPPPLGVSTPPAVVIATSVLDQKRIQQIEIFLNRNKSLLDKNVLIDLLMAPTSTEDINDRIDMLEALQTLYPTPEERELLVAENEAIENAAFDENPQSRKILAKSDSFLINLSIVIPEFKTAAGIRILMETFDSGFTESYEYFSTLIFHGKKILESDALVDLMRIFGSVAAYLSGGPKKTTVLNGFSLENVGQLKKISSFTAKEYSVLNCVAEMIDDWDEITYVLDKSMDILLEYEYPDMVAQSMELEKSITQKLAKTDILKDKKFYEKFIENISSFLKNAYPKVDRLILVRNEADAVTKQLRQYFAENDKKNVIEIFASLKNLRIDLFAASARNSRVAKQRKLPITTPSKAKFESPKTAAVTPIRTLE